MKAIYKRDTKGKLRVWSQQIDRNKFRTIAGVHGGNLVESEWTVCIGKQGRSDEEQALFEVQANYSNKLTREYHETIEATDAGAHFFKPMLAEKYLDFAVGYAQPKLDGIRCIANATGMWSREGKPILGAPHIRACLQPLFDHDPDLVLDGEIYNHLFKDDFNSIVSIVKKQNPTPEQLARSAELAQYHIYDAPNHVAGFEERNEYLHYLFGTDEQDGREDLYIKNGPIRLVETYHVATAAGYDELHGAWMADGYEGSMWRADLPYEQKRSNTLRKRKTFQDGEFALWAILEGLGNWSGVAKKILFLVPGAAINPGDDFVEDGSPRRFVDGATPGPGAIRLVGAGIKGNKKRAAELLTEDHKVVTVQFFALTPDGVPRFPVATKFWGSERTL